MPGWQDYPDAPIPGQAAPAASPQAPMAWQQYPDAPAAGGAATAAAAPQGLPVASSFTQDLLHHLTSGLQEKANALIPATVNSVEGWFGKGNQKPFGENYQNALNEQRGQIEQYQQDNPWANRAALALGLTAAAPVKGAIGAATLGGKVLQGVKVGAPVGAVAGFGQTNDESLGKDLLATGSGAATGAALGGALPLAFDLAAKPIYNWVASKFGSNAVESRAVQQIVDRIGRDASAGGPTAQDMLDIANAAANKPLMLADVGGEGVKGLGERIATSPGPGREVAAKALTARDLQAGTRITGDVNGAISSGGSTYQTAQALDEARRTAAAPLYEKAFTMTEVNPQTGKVMPRIPFWNEAADKLLARPSGQAGLAYAKKIAAEEGQADRLYVPTYENGKLVGDTIAPDWRSWDYIKRGMDALIEDNTNEFGRVNAYGRAVIGTKNDLLRMLDKANPDYAVARQAYSGPSQSLNALRDGAELFKKEPDQIKAEIAELTPGDKEFYKLGAANVIKQKIAKTGMAGNEARAIVSSQWAKDQVRPLFDDKADYDKFMNSILAENRMFQTNVQMLGSSRTAMRQAEREAANPEGGLAGSIGQAVAGMATGEPVVGSLGAFNAAKALFGKLNRPDPEVDAATAKLLFNPNLTANQQTLARILAARQPSAAIQNVGIPLASLGARAYPNLITPSALGASRTNQ